MKILLTFVLIILAMSGLAEFMHFLKVRILAPKRPDVLYTVIVLKGNAPQEQLKNLILNFFWHGQKKYGSVVAINDFLNEVDYTNCRELALKNEIIFTSFEDFKAISRRDG